MGARLTPFPEHQQILLYQLYFYSALADSPYCRTGQSYARRYASDCIWHIRDHRMYVHHQME